MDTVESLTNGTSTLSIPGLDNLQPLMNNLMIVSIITGGVFLVLYLLNVIRHMRADRAMIAMHKDIAAIRELLEHQQTAPRPAVEPPVEPAAQPSATRDESESSLTM